MSSYASILQALADPTRRTILETLRHRPRSVSEIASDLPVSRPAVSQHLRVLREAGLVNETPEGTKRIYEASPEGLDELRRYLEDTWGDLLGTFSSAAKRQKKKSGGKGRKERK